MMKTHLQYTIVFSLLVSGLVSRLSVAQELPAAAFQEILYQELGSCEGKNLTFNAARFSKIPLQRKRDELDLYYQMILFITEDGRVNVRGTEMGLVGCQQTTQGEVCSYRPYPDTKTMRTLSWTLSGDFLMIPGLGRIEKIRDDYPWLGFQFTFNEDIDDPVLRSVSATGGKVQVNFNKDDVNSARLCPL